MPTQETFAADALRATVITFRDLLWQHVDVINRLNVYPVPDGDTGTNMARTLDAVVEELATADPALAPTCQAISHGSLMGARGNSGVILSQILRGLVGGLSTTEGTATDLAGSLSAASIAAYQAVLKPMEGTILTVVRETADGAAAAAAAGAGLAETLRSARSAGRASLARTPDLLPVLRDAGVVDAGGAGFLLFLDAALHVVAGEPLPELDLAGVAAAAPAAHVPHRPSGDGDVDVADLRYEVMYFLDLPDQRIEGFKQRWGEIGDSIVVVGGDGLWNCHVHTNDIGAAIEVALDLDGRPKKIRITDLLEEVAEEHAHREAAMTNADQPAHTRPHRWSAGLPPVTCAVVAVASGDGLAELFGQLGVQGVITGGQTLNPSTAELLSAVEAVNARHVIVLPNNKNIIPVAEQVDGLTSKHVVVVPTTSMPEALAALVVYDPELDAEGNFDEMAAAAAAVATGEITQAVRATSSDAGDIAAGDWIGIVRGDGIVTVDDDLESSLVALLDRLIEPNREILTVIEGADAMPAHTRAVRAWMTEHHPQVQVEVHVGGQPMYPYLFGVE